MSRITDIAKTMKTWWNEDDDPFVHSALDEIIRIDERLPTIEPKTKVVAQITFDEEKLREIVKEAVERFKEEYEITDRPQGEWIEQEDDYHHYWECSECGMGVGLDDIRNYCPNCGAKMKGADDEID